MAKAKRQAGVLKITLRMLRAGVAAYEAWGRFADAPLEGKNRTWLTKREKERLTAESMVCEILTVLFGNAAGGRFDVELPKH